MASRVELVFWLEGAVGLEVETASRTRFGLQLDLISEALLFQRGAGVGAAESAEVIVVEA